MNQRYNIGLDTVTEVGGLSVTVWPFKVNINNTITNPCAYLKSAGYRDNCSLGVVETEPVPHTVDVAFTSNVYTTRLQSALSIITSHVYDTILFRRWDRLREYVVENVPLTLDTRRTACYAVNTENGVAFLMNYEADVRASGIDSNSMVAWERCSFLVRLGTDVRDWLDFISELSNNSGAITKQLKPSLRDILMLDEAYCPPSMPASCVSSFDEGN